MLKVVRTTFRLLCWICPKSPDTTFQNNGITYLLCCYCQNLNTYAYQPLNNDIGLFLHPLKTENFWFSKHGPISLAVKMISVNVFYCVNIPILTPDSFFKFHLVKYFFLTVPRRYIFVLQIMSVKLCVELLTKELLVIY